MAQMRTYTQLIEHWLRIVTTAVITPSTWPERNSMRIVQQLGYHQAGKSSHSSPTEDALDLHSQLLYAYHTIQDGMGNPLHPVLYCCKDIQGALRPILTSSPQACTRVPDGDQAMSMSDQLMSYQEVPLYTGRRLLLT